MCAGEFPLFKELQASFGERGLAIIGISFDKDRAAFERALAKGKFSWPQIFDGKAKEGEIARLFHIEGVPSSYLLDRSGRIAAKDVAGEQLRCAISDLVEQSGNQNVSRPTPGELAAAEERREKFQKVPEVLQALGARPGHWVADVGAGDGFFTMRLARAVGNAGRVFAVNIERDQAALIRERSLADGLTNIASVLGKPDDPKLPPSRLDSVLIVNAYHEMAQYPKMLQHILEALKPGGRFVIIEPSREAHRNRTRKAQVDEHEIAPSIVDQELRDTGFEILERSDPFIPPSEALKDFSGSGAWWMIVARRPA